MKHREQERRSSKGSFIEEMPLQLTRDIYRLTLLVQFLALDKLFQLDTAMYQGTDDNRQMSQLTNTGRIGGMGCG